MDISCDVIRDILPLYAEDLASPATRELVESHLSGCEGCSQELERLKEAQKIPVDTDVHSLRRVSAGLRNRRILTVVCVVMTLVSLIWSGMVFMTTPIALSYEDAIESVELREDGALAIDRARGCIGTGSWSFPDSHDEFAYVSSTRYDWLRGKWEDRQISQMSEDELEDYVQKRYVKQHLTQEDWDRFYTVSTRYCFVNEQGGLYISYTPELEDQVQEQCGPYTQTDHNYDLWYVDGDGTMTLLWGGGDGETNPDVALSYRNDVAFLYLTAFVASVLVAAAAFLGIRFLPNPRLKPHLRILGTVAASLAAALLIVSGFDLSDPTGQRSYFWGQHLLSVTVLLAVTALLWQWLHAMDKQR